MSKKAYIIRYGAYGDNLVITPVLRELKRQKYHVILEYSDRGEAIFKNNPNVDEHVFYKKDSVPFDQLNEYWKSQEQKFGADLNLNFSESLEFELALHPRSPRYNFSKTERFMMCNKNYYEHSMQYAMKAAKYEGRYTFYGYHETQQFHKPELFFDAGELLEAGLYLKADKFNILYCMSGSGKHKAYPWNDILLGSILNEYPEAHIITVGDTMCKMIECHADRITAIAGDVSVRTSMALTGLVDLVISPDTGVLHAAGCYETPKIGLLGHTTKQNITKNFINDYSVESDPSRAECSPCFRLIYDMQLQCPVDPVTSGAYCMAKGIQPETVFEQVKKVHDEHCAAVTA